LKEAIQRDTGGVHPPLPRLTTRIVAVSALMPVSEQFDLQKELREDAIGTTGFAVILTPEQCIGPWAEFVCRFVSLRLFDTMRGALFSSCLRMTESTRTGRRALVVVALTAPDYKSGAVIHTRSVGSDSVVAFADGTEAAELPMDFVNLLDDE